LTIPQTSGTTETDAALINGVGFCYSVLLDKISDKLEFIYQLTGISGLLEQLGKVLNSVVSQDLAARRLSEINRAPGLSDYLI